MNDRQPNMCQEMSALWTDFDLLFAAAQYRGCGHYPPVSISFRELVKLSVAPGPGSKKIIEEIY